MQTRVFAVAGLVAALSAPALAHDMVEVGRTANNKIFPHYHQHHPIELYPSVVPDVTGWMTFDFGFESVLTDDPGHDLFTLDARANLDMILISADPGLGVIDQTGGHLPHGAPYQLGGAYFHVHPTWNALTPAFGSELALTFILRDRANFSSDSDPITITFTTVPAPSAGLALVVLAAARRRR